MVHQSTETVEQEPEESNKIKKPRGDSIDIQSEKRFDKISIYYNLNTLQNSPPKVISTMV